MAAHDDRDGGVQYLLEVLAVSKSIERCNVETIARVFDISLGFFSKSPDIDVPKYIRHRRTKCDTAQALFPYERNRKHRLDSPIILIHPDRFSRMRRVRKV